MSLVRRCERPNEAFGKGEKLFRMGDLLRCFLRCDGGTSPPIITGVANLHSSNQIPMKLGRHDAGLDKVLSEGRMHGTMP
jgi:hypothetical protein